MKKLLIIYYYLYKLNEAIFLIYQMHQNINNSKRKKINIKYFSQPNTPPLSKSLKKSLCSSELMKFISDGIKSKIIFTSAFDYVGSKNFLASKNIALQKILIDEKEIDIIKTNNLNKVNEFSTDIKNEEKKSKLKYKLLTPENSFRHRNESTNTKTKSTKYKKKKKIRKPMTNKFLWSYKIKDIDDELDSFKINKNNRKSHKTHEIRMLKDKDLKLIKPINHFQSDEKKYNFVQKDSEENGNDISLFDMVSQI